MADILWRVHSETVIGDVVLFHPPDGILLTHDPRLLCTYRRSQLYSESLSLGVYRRVHKYT